MQQRYKYPKFFNNLEEYSENNFINTREHKMSRTEIYTEYYKNDYSITFSFNNITKRKIKEVYCKNGIMHCTMRPSLIIFDKKGKIVESYWYHNGYPLRSEVFRWLRNNRKNWIHMKEEEFNQMWMEIL